MTERRPGRGLDPAARAAAMNVARKAAGHRAQTPAPAQAAARQGFETLDDYKSVQAMNQIGEALGLTDPYFRLHEGHATTRSTIDGADCLNFASYDYLGLNADPRPAAAAIAAIETYGVSASASRMVAGERPVHRALEAALARHYGAEAALAFVSGHGTNVSVIGALVGKGDLVLSDRFIHNSVAVGTQLSDAARRTFAHNDLAALARILDAERASYRNVLVVVEGVYSMDGDLPDLGGLIELRDRYGIWLMVDEAHALGCCGATGKGSFEELGVNPADVDIWMGTMSKTLASTGGFIAGSAALIEFLRYFASGFVFSVALPPALAASALTALELLEAEPWRAEKLRAIGQYFIERAAGLGLSTGHAQGFGVLPLVVGESALASKLSERLLERGINVAPALFPGVPIDAARLRFFLSADHSEADVDLALTAVREEIDALDASGFTERAARLTSALAGGMAS